MRVYVWAGTDAARLEIAYVQLGGDALTARGTQIGVEPEPYRHDYVVETGRGFVSERLQAEVELAGGIGSLELRRGRKPLAEDVLDVDLAFSPLFNSLPVLRHGLHRGGDARELTTAFVSVPDLSVSRAQQRYVPLSRGRVRFRAGSFSAELEVDPDGFVTRYPELAERVHPPGEHALARVARTRRGGRAAPSSR